MLFQSIKIFIPIVFLCQSLAGYSQRISLQGEAEQLIEDHRLMKQYEFEVLQLAINNALISSFGSSVTSNYESISETNMSGAKLISSNQSRSQYINSYPNGIWLEHKTDPEYSSYKDEKGNWWLKCSVNGVGEEVVSAPVEFTTKTLDGLDIQKDESISFISGESGYLYFRSAKNGYLLAFYDDFNTVQRCLPYNAMPNDFIPIDAHTDYLFFSPERTSPSIEAKLVDEIEFYTESQLEYNQFYVIFSPEEISLPVLTDQTTDDSNYSTFKTLDRHKFHKWLQNNRLRNNNLQIEIIGITIKAPTN